MGPDAIRNFLDPDQAPKTPLVELPASLNPFSEKDKIRIFAKMMSLTPLLNLKLYPAWNMLAEAEKRGQLKGIDTLIENSSGNMALSLAILAPYFGVKNVQAIVPADIAGTKKELLHLAGVEFIHSTETPGEPSGIVKAKRLGLKKGFRNLGQYGNPANPAAHAKWTAEQVWQQTHHKVTVFAAGMGTTGTVVGAAKYFKDKPTKIAVVGALCAPGNAVPGVRSEAKLKDISFDWKTGIYRVEVKTKESYRKSLGLIRAGFLAGPSSGFALAGLIRFLKESLHSGTKAVNEHVNEDGEIIAVFVAGDIPHIYLDKYSTILDPEDFV
jgi:cysteine synthase